MAGKIILRILLPSVALLLTAANSNAFFGAKFEPADGLIYHCGQAEVRPESTKKYGVDWPGLEEYAKACERRPMLIMHYISFDERAFSLLEPAILEISGKEYTYIPQIGLDFYNYVRGQGIMSRTDITEKIAGGDYDRKISKLARMFKKMDTPAFLRPGYEFGGNGYGGRASKTHWVRAWRRIYDIFQKEHAYNVAFVWNTLDAQDFMDYYPGDKYVDWWAINIFVNNADRDPFINLFIRQAASHRKPVMIAESTPRFVGSSGGKDAWDAWYRPYFNLIFRHINIKAFCYINASWNGYPDRSFALDARIQSNSLVAEKYRAVLSDRFFLNASKK